MIDYRMITTNDDVSGAGAKKIAGNCRIANSDGTTPYNEGPRKMIWPFFDEA